ncbi:Asp23/Gls24 family envelope stress response protein [Yanshouia hominis]|uniref:Asp23/Gls24 family envelope stress response protein n=1 Tax=Yanshouia hominis TaxID=2763673 RepID=A0ABR7NLA1_9FIRM|nr:Asp23/Gls24 family envelope stress response protein [Yanshouia hominis]MBC8577191.1 Asp23/Gls24 family envelope stress response protein [Yanshouia hominis]
MNQMNDGRADAVGTLRISREVLSTIAATAASEVAGVHSLTAAPVDLKGMFSKRQLPKSVAVTLRDDIAEVELHLILNGEVKIPIVSEKVQRAVKDAIQSMTRITVSKVHVVIEGINFSAAAAAI